jgi:16S rRNA (uracil1498-N3)-methyltransferase
MTGPAHAGPFSSRAWGNVADPRFFVDVELAAGATIDLPAGVAHHAAHVLRLRDADPLVLFNGRGGEYHGRLVARGTRAELTTHMPVERESPIAVTLVQAWIATDKIEWVIEKAVELGATGIVLAPARRSVVQLEGARLARRMERLRDIVIAACCQCGRNRLPAVDACVDLPEALNRACASGVGIALQPDAPVSLVDVARSGPTSFAVAVGPEGGFEPGELAHAARAGYRPARLGTRILRTETAGLAALSALQAAVGDLR